MAETFGFIGLGVMGAPMAAHLGKKYSVRVFDIDKEKVKKTANAEAAGSTAEAAKGADVVMLSLPNSETVEAVVIGTDGIAEVMEAGSVVIDTSTTDPDVSRHIAGELEKKGIEFLDSPVSGGEGGAKAGSLAVMVGGKKEVFDRCKPYLETFGKSVVYIGETGAGGTAKLVNQMIVAAEFAVISEGFALAKKNGLDLETLYKAIRGGWAASAVMEVAAPGIINNDFKPGGSIDIIFKDLGYALKLARSGNVPVPMTSTADEQMKTARSKGLGPYAQQILVKLWENEKSGN
jgi:2-hydroxy-3-oxopropionate reductase